MKILINTSNLSVGGGVQVAVSFIQELNSSEYNDLFFVVILSNAVQSQLDLSSFPNNFSFHLYLNSPAILKTRRITQSKLNKLVDEHQPDIAFTIFGPSYWKPRIHHVIGFAVPWVLEPNSVAFSKLPFFSRIKMKLWCAYVLYYLKKDGHSFIIETSNARKKLLHLLKPSQQDVSVIGNCCSNVFFDSTFLSRSNASYIDLPKRTKNEFRLVLISHLHPHKNIEIIRDVLPLLKSYNVRFYFTLTKESMPTDFVGNPNIINLGPVKTANCPSIYSQCDALFHPSLLEVFSASYPEAMASNLPILASNFDFARDVCGSSALYFDPCSPKSIADKIILLINKPDLRKKLIYEGSLRLQELETAKSRASKYIQILRDRI